MSKKKTILAAFVLITALLLGGASICSAADITYNVNLTIGAGSVTGHIVTDGTTVGFGTNNIVGWNLLVNDGFTSFDINSSSPYSAYSEYPVDNPALSATPTQLTFDFDVVSNDSFLDFVGSAGPFAPGYELCFEASPNTCWSGVPAGAEQINYFTYTGVGDVTLYTPLSGPQVIGTVPEPATTALLGGSLLGLFGVVRRKFGKNA